MRLCSKLIEIMGVTRIFFLRGCTHSCAVILRFGVLKQEGSKGVSPSQKIFDFFLLEMVYSSAFYAHSA